MKDILYFIAAMGPFFIGTFILGNFNGFIAKKISGLESAINQRKRLVKLFKRVLPILPFVLFAFIKITQTVSIKSAAISAITLTVAALVGTSGMAVGMFYQTEDTNNKNG